MTELTNALFAPLGTSALATLLAVAASSTGVLLAAANGRCRDRAAPPATVIELRRRESTGPGAGAARGTRTRRAS